MKISLIVAVDSNNGIGKDNQLPWHLPADLKHFKKLTTGHPIIMGRKTFDSIEKPLPNRRNIVISRNKSLKREDVEYCSSLKEALELCREVDEVFVIGGAQIFKASIPIAHYLYLTRIHEAFEADTFFPDIEIDTWKLLESDVQLPDDLNKYPYTFFKYEKA